MGRPKEVADLILAGKTPTQVAADLGVTLVSVEGYLHRAVGEGLLRRSDIYFSIPLEQRASDHTLKQWFSDPQLALGDMYEDIRRIELGLHGKIREALVQGLVDCQPKALVDQFQSLGLLLTVAFPGLREILTKP